MSRLYQLGGGEELCSAMEKKTPPPDNRSSTVLKSDAQPTDTVPNETTADGAALVKIRL